MSTPSSAATLYESIECSTSFAQHLQLLQSQPGQDEVSEMTSAPLFTMPVLNKARKQLSAGAATLFPQYGLLGGVLNGNIPKLTEDESHDPRLFFNVTTPSSMFICGSQGSGKSHTLSCLLENCLINSVAGKLPKPLTGIVFHYDTFISDDGGSPCEAAFLSSNADIKVRVLCSPTNIQTIKVGALRTFGNSTMKLIASLQRIYKRLNVQVDALQINECDLNTKRMIEMMAINNSEAVPLYVHTIYRILREMRVEQQELGKRFDYTKFKVKLMDSGLTPAQLGLLNQRLDTMESFMRKAASNTNQISIRGKTKTHNIQVPTTVENNWISKVSTSV
jgi:hypothetical protein